MIRKSDLLRRVDQQNINIFVFQSWLCYQSLWDLQPDVLYSKLDINLQKWMRTLEEIK